MIKTIAMITLVVVCSPMIIIFIGMGAACEYGTINKEVLR